MRATGLILGTVASLLVSSAAFAADGGPVVVPQVVAPVAPMAPVASPAFSWSGFSIGITPTIYGDSGGPGFGGGLSAGYNFNPGSLVLGIQAQTFLLFYGDGERTVDVTLQARLGIAVGADHRGLLYGTAGVGRYVSNIQPGSRYEIVGGGVDLAITDRLSLSTEFDTLIYGPGAFGFRGQLGATWHLH